MNARNFVMIMYKYNICGSDDKGWYQLCIMGPSKTPQMMCSLAMSTACESRLLWPLWRRSKVPPRQTRVNGAEGGVASSVNL